MEMYTLLQQQQAESSAVGWRQALGLPRNSPAKCISSFLIQGRFAATFLHLLKI